MGAGPNDSPVGELRVMAAHVLPELVGKLSDVPRENVRLVAGPSTGRLTNLSQPCSPIPRPWLWKLGHGRRAVPGTVSYPRP
eukprot:698856-Pyramimonas_sp.AAC.1